jgi:fermentation-respiration switch protein FrsA (DUF1100 family)
MNRSKILLHGEADNVVPVRFGHQLFAAANEPKQALFMPNLTHSTIYDATVQTKVLEFFANLPHQNIVNGVIPLPQ